MSDSQSQSNLTTAKNMLSAVGSVAATIMVVRGVAQEFLPAEFYDYIFSGVRGFLSRFSNQLTMVIEEFEGLDANEIYAAADAYLGPKVSPNTRRLKISKPEKEKHLNMSMERDEEVVDLYKGHKFKWVWVCRRIESHGFYNPRDMNSTLRSEVRSFELTFHKRNREMVIHSYLPHIANEAKMRKQENKTIKIFTVDYENMYNINDMWKPVTLDHPATFATLAMDAHQKDVILKDVDRFLQRRDYYRKVGKAWKRGYLLYGPPGTGKSSFIAAMANYLNFDVYDLELTELRQNSDLRKLLLATANKSILVVEDIDCTIDLQDKLATRDQTSFPGFNNQEQNKVTLSGLLNFVDGLWSSCGDERIIIFTTNHIEKLDPALLRPGRMDVHINMSYCTPCGFRLLASNYLEIKEHPMFEEIEDLLQNAKATPAEVAEQLLKEDEPHDSLQGLIDFLHKKMRENEEGEAEKAKAAAEKQEEEKKEE
ncbi:AAA-ATPase At3g50940-like [Salvia miltiorrhiza]|uniref:AAA-ATPase At3g50940-like n=1 Tax=Salvia miltiorrhiza TaxID=226208 RepID=UPI0025AD4E6C|nr:AAA-ATPase At3g50940-like [Salvia miltiorrhiza]